MKLTEDPEKRTLPGSKAAFRLLGSDGEPPSLGLFCKAPDPPHSCCSCPTHTGLLLLDLLQLAEEPPPQAGQELRVWPRGAQEPCTVRPAQVEPLLRLWLQQGEVTAPHTLSPAETQPPRPASALWPSHPQGLLPPLSCSCVSRSHPWQSPEPLPSSPLAASALRTGGCRALHCTRWAEDLWGAALCVHTCPSPPPASPFLSPCRLHCLKSFGPWWTV